MREKLLSLALALVMCLGLTVPVFAVAPSTFDNHRIIFTNVLEHEVEEYSFYGSFLCAAPVSITLGDEFDRTHYAVRTAAFKVPESAKLTAENYQDYFYAEMADSPQCSDFILGYGNFSESVTLTEPGCYIVGTVASEIDGDGGFFSAIYLVNVQSAADTTPTTVGSFTDVKTSEYFAESVQWAVEKEITVGTSATTFSPNATCTQGQILTFLWRAKGEPKPAGAVSGTQYYAAAAQWAKEQGLTDDFSAGADCTRAMVVTYLWKLAGSPKTGASDFSDVPAGADYAQAVAWAVEQGVTTGTSAATFSPDNVCTRGQIVTFLYRALAK